MNTPSERPPFQPVEAFGSFVVNWKMLALGEALIIAVFLFGIWQSSL